QPPRPTLFPYTTLFRSIARANGEHAARPTGGQRQVGCCQLRAVVHAKLERGHATFFLGVVHPILRDPEALFFIERACRHKSANRSEEHTSELQSPYDLV